MSCCLIRLFQTPICLVFLIAGCANLGWTTLAVGVGLGGEPNEASYHGPAPDPPEIVISTPDSVTVWYDEKVFSEQLHEEAAQLIEDHCGGSFEFERNELDGSFVVEATCK
jgi:hypothetical protein